MFASATTDVRSHAAVYLIRIVEKCMQYSV